MGQREGRKKEKFMIQTDVEEIYSFLKKVENSLELRTATLSLLNTHPCNTPT